MSAPILPERGSNRRPDGPPAARGHLERLIGHYAVDLVFFGDPQVLEDDLDAAFDRDYSQFAFQRQQIEQMPGTPFHRLSVKLLQIDRFPHGSRPKPA